MADGWPAAAPAAAESTRPATGPVLEADCASCFGLCCVAPAFFRSSEFAVDKPAGTPCLHLVGNACSIHDELRPRGFPGCTAYDCFGAGQVVAQRTYQGTSWRAAPATAPQMFRVFAVMRGLHELLWLLSEALALESSTPVRAALSTAVGATTALTESPAAALDGLELDRVRDQVVPLLREAGALARAGVPGPHHELAGADLSGQDLRGLDLRGADLRGAVLLGVDLRAADLHLADVTGADLRGADLRRADLGSTLFLTRVQVAGARGDHLTLLPTTLRRPAHWPADGAHEAGTTDASTRTGSLTGRTQTVRLGGAPGSKTHDEGTTA